MIKVLHIVTYMGRGGLETMIMNYYRNIDRTKVQFDFLVHREFEADYDAEIMELGGKIYRLPNLNPFSRNYLEQLDNFFQLHREYQIVHCHLDCMAGIPLKYAKKHGVKVRIAHAHSSCQTKDYKYILKLLYKKRIVRHATHLFACGKEAGLWMFDTEDFLVLNNAIDCEKYAYKNDIASKKRKELGIEEDSLVIGHVGRFDPPKNHEFIINVFSEIKKRNKKVCLLLVGDGCLKEAAEEQTRTLNLQSSVIFTGMRTDVNELLQCMDVFLFPSIYEGLPLSIIEAQAAGLPCFISDKVPIECKKTDLVKQLSLNNEAKEWAEQILVTDYRVRQNSTEQIKKAGFDIVENAKWLQEFYENQA